MTPSHTFRFSDADYYWNDCTGHQNHAFGEAVPYYGAGNKIEIHYSFPSSTYDGISPFCVSEGFGGMYFTEHDITQGWTYKLGTCCPGWDTKYADDTVFTITGHSVSLGDYVTVTLTGNYGCVGNTCVSDTGGPIISNCHVTQSYQVLRIGLPLIL